MVRQGAKNPLPIDRKKEHLHAGVLGVRAAFAVIENRKGWLPIHSGPLRIVLAEEGTVLGTALVILLRVAHPPNEIAPHPLATAAGGLGFGGTGGVIDHPDFTERPRRNRD